MPCCARPFRRVLFCPDVRNICFPAYLIFRSRRTARRAPMCHNVNYFRSGGAEKSVFCRSYYYRKLRGRGARAPRGIISSVDAEKPEKFQSLSLKGIEKAALARAVHCHSVRLFRPACPNTGKTILLYIAGSASPAMLRHSAKLFWRTMYRIDTCSETRVLYLEYR